ncbi:MAG TPA: helix-hairpin-helix domain-containing protein [Candidatus Thermoplasmatota archaeon]|nr:helix-hairpin-helix domain-containing protein [Candidatus Thermoplasmatota archaeon]
MFRPTPLKPHPGAPASPGPGCDLAATVAAETRASLTELPGVGDALAERLEKEFGSADAFFAAARASEVDRIAAIEGISERRAVELVLTVQGRAPSDFLRTPRAETLYEDILARIASFANTSHARNKISLLVPLPPKEAKERLAMAMAAKRRVASLDRAAVAKLLARIQRPRTPRPKYDSSVCIVVDTDADYQALVKAGVDRFCQLATADDGAPSNDIVIYAYSQGLLDFTGADNVVQVPFSRHVADLVPDAALAYFRENRPIWEAALELSRLLGRKSELGPMLDLLDSLHAKEFDFSKVEKSVNDAVAWMNAEIGLRTKSLSLTGDEVLEMMSGKTPRKVRDLHAAVLREGRERIARETGEDFTSAFNDGFPVKLDDGAMERKRQELEGRRKRAAFRSKVDAARKLGGLRERAEAEIQALLEFDYEFALGSFALEYNLEAPTFGKELRVEGAIHLNLARTGGVPILYVLDQKDQVALLTGANSGGKTTLLETLGQIAILAHLGLPVNAKSAVVPPVEGVYFFTQKRSLEAGAFESFLKGFLPIVTSKGTKLVLADELEAMTELEAASKIVGTFIELLKDTGSYGVCVTHMAEQVSQYTSVRIDGIEARGLDENFNLVVDRSPRMNYRARSTPEFILRRLQSRATGDEKKVYDLILKRFSE